MSGIFIDRRLEFKRDGLAGYRMRNNSGGSVGTGAVVILDTSVQGGDAFTTTTTQDDPLILGVLQETVAASDYGFIAVWGHIDNLKVNGTTDIAAGDTLTTFTTAEIAAKRSAVTKPGQFAVALEAYTTNDSAGVIDAWLTPHLVPDASGNTLTYAVPAIVFGNSYVEGVAASVPRTDATLIPDMNGAKVILDADADTSITADTDDVIDFELLAIDKIKIDGVNNVIDIAVSASNIMRIDVDDDNDSSIRSSVDDQLDIELGGADEYAFKAGSLDMTGNHLDNAGYVIMNAVTLPGVGEVYAGHDNAGDLTLNALTGKTVNFAINGTDEVSIAANSLQLVSGSDVRFMGDDGIRDQNDNELVEFVATGSAITYVTVTNSATTVGPIIGSAGETNVDLQLLPAGTGYVYLADDKELAFGTGKDAAFVWSTGDADNHAVAFALGASHALHLTDIGAIATDWAVAADTHPSVYIHSDTTPATDYLKIYHDATDSHIDMVGAGASNGIKFELGGTTEFQVLASHVLVPGGNNLRFGGSDGIEDGNGLELLDFANVGSAVNAFLITNAATGNPPLLGSNAGGAEANIGMKLNDSNGNELLILGSVASAVNEVSIKNAATGNQAIIAQDGEDDIGFLFNAKNAEEMLSLKATAAATTYVEVLSMSTGTTGPAIKAVGETNVDLRLIPNGTGSVNIAPGTAGTAANPDLCIGGDVDSGLFGGTNVLGLATAGAQAFYIDANQALFVGTSTTTTFTGNGKSVVFDEITAPAGTATNQAQIYAYDSATVTTMAQQKSDGTNADL